MVAPHSLKTGQRPRRLSLMRCAMVPYGLPNQGPNQGPNLWPIFAGIEPHCQYEHENSGGELASFWRSVISFASSAIYLVHNIACDIKNHRRPPGDRWSHLFFLFDIRTKNRHKAHNLKIDSVQIEQLRSSKYTSPDERCNLYWFAESKFENKHQES